MRKKAQSTIEYVLMLTMAVMVVLYAVGNINSPVRTGLILFFDQLGHTIGDMSR